MALRRPVGVVALLAMIAGPLALLPASAASAAPSTSLVISQVYGGGGNSGAPYTHDFVELHNRGASPAATDGMTVQYTSATGTGPFAVGASLPAGSVPPGGYLLVQMAAGSGNGQALPAPDVTGTSAMAAGAGKVALTTGGAGLGCNGGSTPCSAEQLARIVDLVGYGNASFFEGSAAAPTLSNTTAALRLRDGAQDTDDNRADFVAGPPAPRNSGSVPAEPEEPEPDTDQCQVPDTVRTRVFEVQGAGASTPLAGQAVVVRGVVTADFTSGGESGIPANQGSRGFYLEALAEDRDDDPRTSEGVFVFEPAGTFAGAIGDLVAVAGTAGESFGMTRIEAADVDVCATGPVGLPAPAALPLPTPSAERNGAFEPLEGMRVTHAELTVVEHFQLERFGEVRLSSGGVFDNPTNVVDPRDDAAYGEIVADNDAHSILLDNGATGQNLDPLPYVAPGNTLRVGDQLRDATAVLNLGFGSWRLSPVDIGQLTEQLRTNRTRPRPQTPPAVGGDLTVASFNVLNFFNGDGQGGGFPTARGAVTPAELERQTAKLVAALRGMDADVVGLIEMENDEGPFQATRSLVDALNAAYGSAVYDYVDTGRIGTDAIKQAFLYKPASVSPTGAHAVLDRSVDDRFADTRNRPVLAQTFTELASGRAVTVAVNHFKSKGSGCGAGDDDPRQGSCNGTRTLAAAAMVDWLKTDPTGQAAVGTLVIGDLNAYAKEDPITTVLSGGYVDLLEQFRAEGAPAPYSYTFDGTQGRLDHALADEALAAFVTGADEWHINADEASALDYQQSVGAPGNARFRTARTAELYYAPDAFRSSDHDPVLIGLSLAEPAAEPVEVQVLGINDFHGRLGPPASTAPAGTPSTAGRLAGAVDRFRAEVPNTAFVSAGDNIGATPFISSVAQDRPTIEVLNAMGLDVSAVGNHEFDRGWPDLRDRVVPLSDFPILGANVEGANLPGSHVVTTTDGVRLGFVGVVTRQTSSLVNPSGIAGITFSDPVAAANREAAALTDGDPANGEADVVVLLAHEGAAVAASNLPGAPRPEDCDTIGAADDDFGRMIRDSSPQIDAIFGGHTHLRVTCAYPQPAEARGDVRPVLEAADYGTALGRLRFTFDPGTSAITDIRPEMVTLSAAGFPTGNARIDELVRQADQEARVLGQREIGSITGDLTRAFTPTGDDDRGAESVLGNFIADVQLEAANLAGRGPADLALMNPGGLRADFRVADQYGTEAPGVVTFGEAGTVQPFANTLFTVDLTGEQVRQVLEQQYQPAGSTRPFLALGVSKGLFFVYDDDAPAGSRVSGVTLNGAPLDPSRTYRVVVNSFLASGGDNFTVLRQGANRTDTGLDDLTVLVEYFERNSPITPDTAPRRIAAADLPDPGPDPQPEPGPGQPDHAGQPGPPPHAGEPGRPDHAVGPGASPGKSGSAPGRHR
jgi:predicted extracellular nuclease/2',3'-cyclic-nucleotide 2'-phosphodiesterase (5'-nucleotidase family)